MLLQSRSSKFKPKIGRFSYGNDSLFVSLFDGDDDDDDDNDDDDVVVKIDILLESSFQAIHHHHPPTLSLTLRCP